MSTNISSLVPYLKIKYGSMFECLNCKKETKNKKFCSSSCSASFNNSKRVLKRNNCLSCNVVLKNSTSIYCGNKCLADYKYKTVLIPLLILKGEGSSKTLKRYLKETKGDVCVECGQGNIHNGKELTLQLDHIDGNSDNNRIENLRLLCPNCHTQTETFGSRGGKKETKRNQYLRKYKKKI